MGIKFPGHSQQAECRSDAPGYHNCTNDENWNGLVGAAPFPGLFDHGERCTGCRAIAFKSEFDELKQERFGRRYSSPNSAFADGHPLSEDVRAPKRIFDAHPPDQHAQLRVDLRSPSQWAQLPTPVAAKAGPTPAQERIRPDDCENLLD